MLNNRNKQHGNLGILIAFLPFKKEGKTYDFLLAFQYTKSPSQMDLLLKQRIKAKKKNNKKTFVQNCLH